MVALADALSLASRGWRLLPVHPIAFDGSCGCGGDCAAAGKHPRLPAWQKHASADPADVREWWNRGDAGVGVATGAESGVVVIDLDPRHGGDVSFADLLRERGERIETLRVATGGGGYHLYFKAPEQRIGNRAGVLPGVDVRGEGGFVVGPGSPHASGTNYRIDRDIEPIEMPGWLIDLCTLRTPATAVDRQQSPPVADIDARERRYALAALDNASRRLSSAAEGGRHDAAVREAYGIGGFVGSGLLSEGVARAALVEAAMACGLGEAEAAKVVDDGLSAGADAPLRAPDTPRERTRAEAPAAGPAAAGAPEDDGDVPGSWVTTAPPPDPGYFDRGDEVEFAQHIASQLGGRDRAVFDEAALWLVDDGGGWEEVPLQEVARWAHGFAGRWVRVGTDRNGDPKFSKVKLSQRGTAGIAKAAGDYLLRAGFFADAPHGAAFKRSFARVDGHRVVVEPLTPDHRARRSGIADYSLPRAGDASVFVGLLEQTWADCPDKDDRVRYLLEWTGAALLGIATRWKDSPLLFGAKDTGKSRIVDAVLGLFPATSRRHVSLHDMTNPAFLARLAGARINAVSELPARELLEGQKAKAVLSGDAVVVKPLYKNPFEFRPRCAHIFAANELPPSLDSALRERFVLLHCPNVVPRERQDPVLAAKLAAEAPVIAAVALECAEDLLRRGHFIRPGSSAAAAERWAVRGDSVGLWALDSVEASVEAATAASVLYRDYREWCVDNGHRPTASNKWAERMAEAGFDRIRSNGSWWMVEHLTPAAREAGQRWGLRDSP